MITRRQFLPLICAPAIIRVADLMPIKPLREDYTFSVYVKGQASFPGKGLYIGPGRALSVIEAGNDWHRLVLNMKDVTEAEALSAAQTFYRGGFEPRLEYGRHLSKT